MVGLIKKLFNSEKTQVYNIAEVKANDLSDIAYTLNDIKERKIDGLVIRNVLSAAEVTSIIDNLPNLSTDLKFEVDGCGGFLYPLTFNQLRENENYRDYTERYFRQSQQFRENFKSTFKVDIEEKFIVTLGKLNRRGKVKVLHGIKPFTFLAPATLRVFPPQMGGVWAHCHNNDDIDLHPEFAKHFQSLMPTKNWLSFFIMLQKPDAGGELTLLNVEHKDAVEKRGAVEIVKKDGSIVRSDDEDQKMRIHLHNGDMVVFAGGDIWHQVEDSVGQKNRVTVGGFGSFAYDNATFYFWS